MHSWLGSTSRWKGFIFWAHLFNQGIGSQRWMCRMPIFTSWYTENIRNTSRSSASKQCSNSLASRLACHQHQELSTSWDVNEVLWFLSNLGVNISLCLSDLTLKLRMLLVLISTNSSSDLSSPHRTTANFYQRELCSLWLNLGSRADHITKGLIWSFQH